MTIEDTRLAWERINPTHAIAMFRDDNARLDGCGPLDWPDRLIESTVVDASRDIDRTFYERNTTVYDGTDHDAETLIDRLDRKAELRGWTHATITLTDAEHWLTLHIATDPAYAPAESVAAALRQWWDGDVVVFELQRLTTWTSDDGRTRTEWETIDAIGDNYPDPNRDWKQQALEALGVDL